MKFAVGRETIAKYQRMRFLLAATAALSIAGTAQAAVVTLFSDDFSADTPALAITTSLTNWTVTGNVDVVGMPNIFGITCDGNCVDLDGTTGPGSIRSAPIAYAAGAPVTIRFDLSGSQRDQANDEFGFFLSFSPGLFSTGGEFDLPGFGADTEGPLDNFAGIGFQDFDFPGNSPWASYFYTFNPTTAGTFSITFSTDSADNIGPLLDNVLVTQGVIPEPATWAMLIAGFGLVGAAARRRRTAVAA
jgi:hypothetical protein